MARGPPAQWNRHARTCTHVAIRMPSQLLGKDGAIISGLSDKWEARDWLYVVTSGELPQQSQSIAIHRNQRTSGSML